MLDVILDCCGALLLLGQAAWVLARGQIQTRPNARPAIHEQRSVRKEI